MVNPAKILMHLPDIILHKLHDFVLLLLHKGNVYQKLLHQAVIGLYRGGKLPQHGSPILCKLQHRLQRFSVEILLKLLHAYRTVQEAVKHILRLPAVPKHLIIIPD